MVVYNGNGIIVRYVCIQEDYREIWFNTEDYCEILLYIRGFLWDMVVYKGLTGVGQGVEGGQTKLQDISPNLRQNSCRFTGAYFSKGGRGIRGIFRSSGAFVYRGKRDNIYLNLILFETYETSFPSVNKHLYLSRPPSPLSTLQ